MVSESQLRKIIDLTIEELGENATKENIQAVVAAVLNTYENDEANAASEKNMTPAPLSYTKAMVSVLGPKNADALAALSSVFSKHNCEIMDISQKALHTLSAFIFIVDTSKLSSAFSILQNDLQKEAQALGLALLTAQE